MQIRPHQQRRTQFHQRVAQSDIVSCHQIVFAHHLTSEVVVQLQCGCREMGRGQTDVVSVGGVHHSGGQVEALGRKVFLRDGVVLGRMVRTAVRTLGHRPRFGALVGAVDHAYLQTNAECALAKASLVSQLRSGIHIFIEGAFVVVEEDDADTVLRLSEAIRHVGGHEDGLGCALVQPDPLQAVEGRGLDLALHSHRGGVVGRHGREIMVQRGVRLRNDDRRTQQEVKPECPKTISLHSQPTHRERGVCV